MIISDMPKYSFTINIQLDKFLGDNFRFQSRSFSVGECETKTQAENECKEWMAEYVVNLVGKRKAQKDKTLSEEMLLEFGEVIKKNQEASKKFWESVKTTEDKRQDAAIQKVTDRANKLLKAKKTKYVKAN